MDIRAELKNNKIYKQKLKVHLKRETSTKLARRVLHYFARGRLRTKWIEQDKGSWGRDGHWRLILLVDDDDDDVGSIYLTRCSVVHLSLIHI